ncbi:hypothetical protein BGZ96_010491 [Linnemannia gamsii]|uniref:Acyl-protein thioesterase 1 n=1 Tax=Linnemannia gamsii TaxID=64522 RepID=A0ABQ7KES9_9FUNG|nr:hypothetical protein BGZ96_010491 [Linnemannia gamsii]
MSPTPEKLTSFVQQATAKHSATVISLHALGGYGKTWTIPTDYGTKLPSWYDLMIDESVIAVEQDEAGMLKSRQTRLFVRKLRRTTSPANRIVIGGNSRGAAMALLIGLSAESYKFSGIVSLSGYMPLLWKFMKTMTSDANRRTPVF